jgi:hypothetical protein
MNHQSYNVFLLFMGTIILMPIILMGAYHCNWTYLCYAISYNMNISIDSEIILSVRIFGDFTCMYDVCISSVGCHNTSNMLHQ